MVLKNRMAALQEAAARWSERAPIRTRNVKAARRGDYLGADTPEKLLQYANRLTDHVADSVQRRDVAGAAAARIIEARPLTLKDISNKTMERVINASRDFLSIEFLERGLAASRSVGRIRTMTSFGTGFLVGPNMMLTNWHVLDSEAVAAVSSIEMDVEPNTFGVAKSAQTFECDPATFFLTSQDLDATFVAVKPRSLQGSLLSDYGYIPLIAVTGKAITNEPLNIVQHPKGREKEVVMRDSHMVDLPPSKDGEVFFHYTSDTEQGSSGAPVFNDRWEVVALHHEGVPKTNENNELVDVDGNVLTAADLADVDESRLVWIANEGIRASRLARHLGEAILPEPQRDLRDRIMALWKNEKIPIKIETASVAPTADAAASGALTRVQDVAPPRGGFRTDEERDPPGAEPPVRQSAGEHHPMAVATLVVPLRIDISLGTPYGRAATASAVGPAPHSGPSGAFAEAARPADPSDPDYRRRPGYQPGFLGIDVPLPKLVSEVHGPLLKLPDGTSELKYHHFSVLMNARRRLAYVAAVNIHATAAFEHERDDNNPWFYDARLPRRQQAGAAYYSSNPLDRGHLVRRDDAAWGATAEEAARGDEDSFHWTNCAPQHEIFNQSGLATKRGLLLWGNLENAVSAAATDYGGKLCVFNGPVFADTDRAYRKDFLLPEAYWKLVVLLDGKKGPRALAFQLSQAEQLKGLVTERFEAPALAEFVVFQIPIAKLSATTGLDFGPLAAWDPLAEGPGGATTRTESSGAGVLLVRTESAIRL